ncbi:RHS repeat protein, partial [Luteimonas sp. XNQY3]
MGIKAGASLSLLLMLPFNVLAQDAIQAYVEYGKRVEESRNLAPLDHGLFGEQVSLYNGSTTFSVTDIDVPGNDALPVRLARTFAVEIQPQNDLGTYDSRLRGIGNWDVAVPYMAGTYSASTGAGLRCDGGYVPSLVIGAGFRRDDVWQGITVSLPERGSTQVLGLQASTPRPTGAAGYTLTTSERDVFDCIPMQPGFAGQGFRMTTASGLRYHFDVETVRTTARLVRHVKVGGLRTEPVYLDRSRRHLLASRVEDRFGNTVRFQYNANGHPTRIWSSDGREIVLAYSGGRLTTANSHGRTWQYQYSHAGSGHYARLSRVVQPDASTWQYAYSNDLMPWPTASLPTLAWCAGSPLMISAALTLTATHPSGAVGTFDFNNRRHYRSGVHATECMPSGDPANPDYDLLVPHFFDVMSIASKSITGSGVSAMSWSYDYGASPQLLWGSPTAPSSYPCTTCAAEKTVTVTNPDSTRSRHTFGMRYHDNDGRALKVETLRSDDTIARSETTQYMTEAQAASQPFDGQYGAILGALDPATARVRPVVGRAIRQDGVDFIWQASAFDTLARPQNVTRSSALPGSPSRTEVTQYHDNLSKWVLGQQTSLTVNGIVGSETSYNANAQPTVSKTFGRTVQTLAYNADGTVATVKDGNNNITTLSNWYRGIPRSIQYPGGSTQSAVVGAAGWLTRVTDENGFATNYAYDAMGRLASVAYPTGDSTAWNTTTQVFQPVASAEYGIPAGHWRQTVSTGTGRRISYFDALWRPLLVREYDTANEAGTQRFQRFAYDHAG